MLKKRLIGVVTVKDGQAVQSFGYRRYLPLGKPEYLLENLERWAVDEIFVQVIDRAQKEGPDFQLLDRLGKLGLSTPLLYGGGIANASDATEVIRRGAERIVVDSLIHDDFDTIRLISNVVGAQAVIACLPLRWTKTELRWFNYRARTSATVSLHSLDFLSSDIISEIFVVDYENEGSLGGFDLNIVQRLPRTSVPIIVFGGLTQTHQIREALNHKRISAVAIGNSLNYKEHSIQQHKKMLADLPMVRKLSGDDQNRG